MIAIRGHDKNGYSRLTGVSVFLSAAYEA